MSILDIESYLIAWKKRLELQRENEKKLADEAFSIACSLGKFLVEKYNVDRVYLFGSLALHLKGLKRFQSTSDIDLAVEGLPKDKYFHILAEINRLSEFKVDIVDLEDCPKVLKDSILKNGIIINEKRRDTNNSR